MIDVLFVCDADEHTGFGHAACCLHLARLVSRRQPHNRIAFQGTFSARPRRRMASAMPDLDLINPAEPLPATVAVINRMADTNDMNAWDRELVDRVRSCCSRVVFIASGVTVPALPPDVICVGYLPDGPESRPPSLYWGFEFAPVAVDMLPDGAAQHDPERILIAFGGSPDGKALRMAAAAVARVPDIRRIDILLSPVNQQDGSKFAAGTDQEVVLHDNVASVGPLLRQAGVVLASFGHLAYEALALGAPLCLLGQKRFQAELAARFQDQGLAVSAGLIDDATGESLAASITETLRRGQKLAQRGAAAVDGKGLDRIAALILEQTPEVECALSG